MEANHAPMGGPSVKATAKAMPTSAYIECACENDVVHKIKVITKLLDLCSAVVTSEMIAVLSWTLPSLKPAITRAIKNRLNE